MKKYSIQGHKDTRSGFGDGLAEIAKTNPNVVAMCADLTGSVKFDKFQKENPERFFQAGIAEANMIDVAAGLATAGKVPFVGTFAAFATGRVYDQIRQCLAYTKSNVTVCASHAGITLGEDGATHQIMEDLGLMKMLPNMTVINPADYNQTKAAVHALEKHVGPAYLRFGRPVEPMFTCPDDDLVIGKAVQWSEGNDVTIIATGHLLYRAVKATEELIEAGYTVDLINIHTIKPLDTEAILTSIKKTKCCVVAEEHLCNGGLGDSVAQLFAKEYPAPIEYVSVDDKFGESGTPSQLMAKYGLETPNVVAAAKRAISRKTR